jgi:signal peptidase
LASGAGWGLLLLVVGLTLLGKVAGMQLLSVQSGSMAPLIRKGDAVLVEPVSAGQLAVGDIVSYRSIQSPGVVITHRVIDLYPQRGMVSTKGDSNAVADPPVAYYQIAGRVHQRILAAGFILDGLRTIWGITALVYVPAAVVVLVELQRLQRYFRPTYVHRRLLFDKPIE